MSIYVHGVLLVKYESSPLRVNCKIFTWLCWRSDWLTVMSVLGTLMKKMRRTTVELWNISRHPAAPLTKHQLRRAAPTQRTTTHSTRSWPASKLRLTLSTRNIIHDMRKEKKLKIMLEFLSNLSGDLPLFTLNQHQNNLHHFVT